MLGLTARVDVVEALEKRVKSRFSHRYVHLSLPRSIPAFWEICKDSLTATKEDLAKAGHDVNAKGLDKFLAFWLDTIEVSLPIHCSLQSLTNSGSVQQR